MRHVLPVLIVSGLCGTMLPSLSYADDAPAPVDTSAPVPVDGQPADATVDSSSFHIGDVSKMVPNWVTNPGSINLFGSSASPAEQNNAAPVVPLTTPPPAPGTPIQPTLQPDYLEGGTNYSKVSKGGGDWMGQYVRGEKQTDSDNRWNATLAHQQEFHSDAYYGAIGNTHNFNDDWYSDVDFGASPEGLVLPQYRVDAFLNRKIAEINMIVTGGVGEYWFRDSHRTTTFFVGDAWYFAPRWIAQGGVNFNISNPGSVDSASAFLAMTEGRNKNYFLTGRYGFGREAYQVIGPGKALSDFSSQSASITWKQWMLTDWGYDDKWGFILGGEYYTNPSYHRIGGNVALFREF